MNPRKRDERFQVRPWAGTINISVGLSNQLVSAGVLSLEIGPALDMQRTKGYDMGIILQVETPEHLASFAKDARHLRLAKDTADMLDDYLRIEGYMSCANRLQRTALHSIWLSKHVLLARDRRRATDDAHLFIPNQARLVEGYYVKLCSTIQWIRNFRWAYNLRLISYFTDQPILWWRKRVSPAASFGTSTLPYCNYLDQ